MRSVLKRLYISWMLLPAVCAYATEASSVPEISPARGTVQVAFSPWDDTERLLVEAIAKAKNQILVQAYILTSRAIATGLIDAKQRGVDVKILADNRQHEESIGSLLGLLAQNKIPVWLETRYRNAHNKVLIIDALGKQPAVITGSYNFTRSANTVNAENLVIFRDDRNLTERFAKNWERHWHQATPYFSAEKK